MSRKVLKKRTAEKVPKVLTSDFLTRFQFRPTNIFLQQQSQFQHLKNFTSDFKAMDLRCDIMLLNYLTRPN